MRYCHNAAAEHTYLVGGRRHRHATRIRRTCGPSADSTAADPFSGHVFVFRGRRGDRLKVLWFDGDGMCLFCKRLEIGRFVWPQADSGRVALTAAQLSMLLEGIDWRRPVRTARPTQV